MDRSPILSAPVGSRPDREIRRTIFPDREKSLPSIPRPSPSVVRRAAVRWRIRPPGAPPAVVVGTRTAKATHGPPRPIDAPPPRTCARPQRATTATAMRATVARRPIRCPLTWNPLCARTIPAGPGSPGTRRRPRARTAADQRPPRLTAEARFSLQRTQHRPSVSTDPVPRPGRDRRRIDRGGRARAVTTRHRDLGDQLAQQISGRFGPHTQFGRGLARGEFDDRVQFTEDHHQPAKRRSLLGHRQAVDTHIRQIALPPPDVSYRGERVGRPSAGPPGARGTQWRSPVHPGARARGAGRRSSVR